MWNSRDTAVFNETFKWVQESTLGKIRLDVFEDDADRDHLIGSTSVDYSDVLDANNQTLIIPIYRSGAETGKLTVSKCTAGQRGQSRACPCYHLSTHTHSVFDYVGPRHCQNDQHE